MKSPNSLKVRILINLILWVSFAWALTLVIGFVATEKTLNEQLDSQLEQFAHSLSETVVTRETTQISRGDSESSLQHERIEVQITHTENGTLDNPEEAQIEANRKWRFFSANNHAANIRVGEDLDMRSAIMRNMLWNSFWPMIVALPLLALIIWFSVTRGLTPLMVLADAIKKRTPEQLSKISIRNVPEEVVPVIQSLNELLEVVKGALNREKEFTDNAAHELRTPLATIKTHAQVALQATSGEEKMESLKAIHAGVDRASHLVNQLLILARLDPENLNITFSSVNLNQVVATVIAKMTRAAMTKKIDLGFLESPSVLVSGDQTYLEILITNLVDNAIRYTPISGTIDIQIQSSGKFTILSIEDSGTGIRVEDRARVFDRFVRLPGNPSEGSGIGLAIVKKIVQLHHGAIELSEAQKPPGLCVKVTLSTFVPV